MAGKKAARKRRRPSKKRIRCPECGSYDVRKEGDDYVCMACGLIFNPEKMKEALARHKARRAKEEARAPKKRFERDGVTERNGFMLIGAGIAFMAAGYATEVLFLPAGLIVLLIGIWMAWRHRKR